MKNNLTGRCLVFCTAALVTAGLILSCGEGVDITSVTFFIGKVNIVRGGTAVKPSVNMTLNDGDVITTGPNSLILLQMADAAIIRINENSSVDMKSLGNAKKRELAMSRGKVLSSIRRLQKDSVFSVITPTATASVRGTEFSVSYDPAETIVAVRHGKVEVMVTDKQAAETIDGGTTYVITKRQMKRPISGAESLELEKLSSIPTISGMRWKMKNTITGIIWPLLGRDAIPETTIPEMKAKYGRTDIVTLYDGRVLTGVILTRGPVYTILTTAGVVSIPEKKIRNTQVK